MYYLLSIFLCTKNSDWGFCTSRSTVPWFTWFTFFTFCTIFRIVLIIIVFKICIHFVPLYHWYTFVYCYMAVLRSTNHISFLSWPVNTYSIKYFHIKLYTLSITLSYFRLDTGAGSICYCPYWWKLVDLNNPQYLHFSSALWVHLVSI